MKVQILLFYLFNFYCISNFAQDRLIVCSTEQNADNSLSIMADSKAFGDYTVILTFKSISGYRSTVNSDMALITVPPGRTQIVKLTQDKSANSFSMDYSYKYYAGIALRRKPDSNFIYLMPGKEGSSLFISKVGSVAEILGQTTTNNFSATGFVYHFGDTICAARSGLVYNVSDLIKEGEKEGQFFKRERNFIAIEHKDGTLGRYEMPSPIKLLVKFGEYIIPGQPLAVFNKESERYSLLFSVSYLDADKASVNSNFTISEPTISPYVYFSSVFYVDESNKSSSLTINKKYIVLHSREIMGLEMNKKDKKKIGLN